MEGANRRSRVAQAVPETPRNVSRGSIPRQLDAEEADQASWDASADDNLYPTPIHRRDVTFNRGSTSPVVSDLLRNLSQQIEVLERTRPLDESHNVTLRDHNQARPQEHDSPLFDSSVSETNPDRTVDYYSTWYHTPLILMLMGFTLIFMAGPAAWWKVGGFFYSLLTGGISGVMSGGYTIDWEFVSKFIGGSLFVVLFFVSLNFYGRCLFKFICAKLRPSLSARVVNPSRSDTFTLPREPREWPRREVYSGSNGAEQGRHSMNVRTSQTRIPDAEPAEQLESEVDSSYRSRTYNNPARSYNHLPSYMSRANRQSMGASGGWNGERVFHTSTPASTNRRESRRIPAGSEVNFRPDSRFREMSSGHRVSIREDQNTQHSYDQPALSLSAHDIEVITDDSHAPLVMAHTPPLPEFSGKHAEYAAFRRDFLSLLPNIYARHRLGTLRQQLKCPEAKRIIEDFEQTDVETFLEALDALDKVYNDEEENANIIIDEITKLTSTPVRNDEDFIKIVDDMKSHLKRLVKIKPAARAQLESLTRTWKDFVPDKVWYKARSYIGPSKATLTFDILFNIAEEYATTLKNTREWNQARERVKRTTSRAVNMVYNADVSEDTFASDGEESVEVNLLRSRDRPKSWDCVLCSQDGHHTTSCGETHSLEHKRSVFFGQKLCLLCAGKGHWSDRCRLLKIDATLKFKCVSTNCANKVTHSKIVCEIAEINKKPPQ